MSFIEMGLTKKVIGLAMRVHRILGSGYLESVYQKALTYEMRSEGLMVEPERKIQVFYLDQVVGDFTADLLVDGELLIELKAIERLARVHEVQLVNYLTATGKEIGLLINFGGNSLEFKRKFRQRMVSQKEPKNSQELIL